MKRVIDLSQHNGEIDFSKVKQEGINDVILRIGWIGNYNNHTIDTRFNNYYNEAKKNGLNVGIYVFSYCLTVEAMQSGVEWVKNLLTNKTLELPVFLDLEDDEHSQTKISICGKENLTEQAITFCRNIENYGFKAGVYASKDWFTRLIDPWALEKYKIWLAEWYVEKPTVSFKVDLWQYTDKEQVYGINKPCDCSQCFCEINENNSPTIIDNGERKDFEEMKKYINGTTPEDIFANLNCSMKVGTLFPHGECECLGVFENKAILRYPIYNGSKIIDYKIGFAKWLGGIQN